MDNRTFRADDRLNQLNDRDEMWGPLLFLRPERHQPISAARALTLATLLGVFFGMLGNVMLGLMLPHGGHGRPPVLLMPLFLAAMYFLCGQPSFVAAWNRRARLYRRADYRRPPILRVVGVLLAIGLLVVHRAVTGRWKGSAILSQVSGR